MTTPLMTRILFATDFSDDASHAQEFAICLTAAWDASLDVLHVLEAPPWLGADVETIALIGQAKADAARRLEAVRDQMMERNLSVRVRQVLGKPHEQICLAAKTNGASLVVMGVQGQTNLMYGLIGSTVERVMREGPCPVLAVPGLREEAGKPLTASRQVPIRHILVPVDFSGPSLDAAEYAIQLAKGLGAAVTLMHVLEPVCYDLDCGLGLIEEEVGKRDHWTRQLTELTQFAAAQELEATFEISGGMPSDAILACALRHQFDLVVMGTHGRRGLSDSRFGSVAEAVIRQATCPVLTVKTLQLALDHIRVMPQAMAERPLA